MKTTLTEANFLLFAAQHYDSVFPDTIEFYEDLKRIVYLKRLFNIYIEKNDLKERLILNHLIVLYNMFGNECTPMLFLRLEGYESILKTFLIFINRMPDCIEGLGIAKRNIINADIPIDTRVLEKLKKI